MKTMLKNLKAKVQRASLSSLATFALAIVTVAANQRCWYVVHEEKFPESYKTFRRF